MENGKIRIAIIGTGKMGLLHASMLNVQPDVELVALCDKSKLMNRLAKKVFARKGVKVVDDVEKLSGLDLDAAYITTPISSHYFLAENLLSKGITRNLFVEKTLADNFGKSQKLCELAENGCDVNMVGYMKRFSVVFGKAKQLIEQDGLGEPKSFKAYAYSSDFLGLTQESKSSSKRGGALRDIGCHIIDLTLWMLGDLEVQNVLSINKTEGNSEIAASFAATNKKGLSGCFDISQAVPNYRMPEFGLIISCPKGEIDVNDDRVILKTPDGSIQKWYRQNLGDNVGFSIGEAEYFRENQHFVHAVQNGGKCEPRFKTASKVDQIIDQVKARSEAA